jgi:hypothetical protein
LFKRSNAVTTKKETHMREKTKKNRKRLNFPGWMVINIKLLVVQLATSPVSDKTCAVSVQVLKRSNAVTTPGRDSLFRGGWL